MTKKNRRKDSAGRQKPDASPDQIYGVHAVSAALSNPKRKILSVYATKNGINKIQESLGKRSLSAVDVAIPELSKRLGRDAVHQGVMVEAHPLESMQLEDILAGLDAARPLIILDQVTDPHNVGAILRSAAAFNAAGVILTRRNSPPLDGVLAKAASGAVEHVPVILVTNLARALEEVSRSGVQTIGLDGLADTALEAAPLAFPCALVLGAEGKGLRRLSAENCDLLCRLTTTGPLNSLNVSNAAAVALHTLVLRAK